MGIPRAMWITENEIIRQFGTNLPSSLGRVRERVKPYSYSWRRCSAPLHRSRDTSLQLPLCPSALNIISEATPLESKEGSFHK